MHALLGRSQLSSIEALRSQALLIALRTHMEIGVLGARTHDFGAFQAQALKIGFV
jgi:hypothetical protein